MTIPALPDAEKVASSAALRKLPLPAPLFDDEPGVTPSNVSVLRPSALSLTPAASTMRRGRSGHHDELRGGIDLAHDRRRVVGARHIDRENGGAGDAVDVGGLHREGIGVAAVVQRIDRGGIGNVGVGAVGIHRQRAVEAGDRGIDRAGSVERGVAQRGGLAVIDIVSSQRPREIGETVVRGRIGELAREFGSQRRRVIGAGDGDRDRFGDEAAMMVVDRGGVGQRQRFAGREEIELVVGNVIGPAHRTGVGIAAGRRQFSATPRPPCCCAVRDRSVMPSAAL